MTSAVKLELMDVLQVAWDASAINKHSSPDRLHDAYVARAGDQAKPEFDPAWFVENEKWIKQRLQSAKIKKIEEAVTVLFDEVNGGNQELLVDPIGQQHRFLLDGFAMLVLKAINNHARYEGNPPTSDRLSEIRIATRKIVTAEWIAATGLTEDDLLELVQDEVRAKGASFDGRIGRWLQRVVVQAFEPRRK